MVVAGVLGRQPRTPAGRGARQRLSWALLVPPLPVRRSPLRLVPLLLLLQVLQLLPPLLLLLLLLLLILILMLLLLLRARRR
jgi:hypothetical protein